ncbi:MAG: acetate/propionate family kinase [Rhizobacter sp.]|nr:acetate/propionate family kinase [Ferruginibacter sp.]
MNSTKHHLVTINGGSSSIKFALYERGNMPRHIFSGSIENIGTDNTTLSYTDIITGEVTTTAIKINGFEEAANYVLDWLEGQPGFDSVQAMGHRLVHGMQHTKAEKISDDLLNELKRIRPYDPDHLPAEIMLIELFANRHPSLVQVACFDTAFHNSMPLVARLLPLPRKYFDMGIQRYGFHGLSYAYLMRELESIAGSIVANGKTILAHLGSGASLAAVKDGKSIDTSMGFTPTSGLVMGTRTGDLDPGVAWYLMQEEKLTPQQFNHLVNHESGLLGIYDKSADMRDIIQNKNTDANAAEAFDLFCYQTKKFIGAYAAALEGLDTLIFSGGIGAHSPEVRNQVCDGLEFIGIEMDEVKNMNNEAIISSATSKVTVRVIKTNEELIMAELVCDVLDEAI